MSHHPTKIDPIKYSKVINLLRDFFRSKNFIEVPTWCNLSILAACEDPETIATFNYAGELWPLPQTGQMHLEEALLDNPHLDGVYCIGASFRNEPNPKPGRHDLIFPLFDFEFKGDLDALIKMQHELFAYLGFRAPTNVDTHGERFPILEYDEIKKLYNTKEVDHEHEARLEQDFGPVVSIKYFPNYTSPFWNMKQSPDRTFAFKTDLIVGGMETVGSAERSIYPDEMRDEFHTISDGGYANLLYRDFTKERVEKELDDYLSKTFIQRSGAGIGITRLIKAMEKYNLL